MNNILLPESNPTISSGASFRSSVTPFAIYYLYRKITVEDSSLFNVIGAFMLY